MVMASILVGFFSTLKLLPCRFIAHPSISSVVAISTSSTDPCAAPATPVTTGHPSPTPPTTATPTTSISAPIIPAPTLQTNVSAILASPSATPYSSHFSPTYFVRSGYILLTYGSLRDATRDSTIWSSTTYPANIQNSLNLYFNHVSFYLSSNDIRYYGYSLRDFISISLPYISSVVAISLLSTAHSDTAAAATSLGDQAPTPPTPNAPLIFASFPGTHTHHTATTATTDIPSIFITLLSISSVVALSLSQTVPFVTPAISITSGLPQPPLPIPDMPSTSISTTPLTTYPMTAIATTASPSAKILIMPLLSISSVVAISNYSAAHSVTPITTTSPGVPLLSLSKPKPPPISASFPITPIHHIAPTSTAVSPSAFTNISLYVSPLYFVRSGNISLRNGSLMYAGIDSNAQSATAFPALLNHAFAFYFRSSTFFASANGGHYDGFPLSNLILIPLICISSVVAVSILPLAHSTAQAAIISPGAPAPTPLSLKIPSASISAPLAPTPQATMVAHTVSPFVFIALSCISSVVAISIPNTPHSSTPAAIASPGHPQPSLATFASPPTLASPQELPTQHTTLIAATASPSFSQTGYPVPTFVFSHPCYEILKLGTLYPLCIFNHFLQFLSKPSFFQNFLHTLPMYFVRSGYIDLPNSSLRIAGYYGHVWSSAAYVADIRYASYLSLDSTTTHSSNSVARYYGFSLHQSSFLFHVFRP